MTIAEPTGKTEHTQTRIKKSTSIDSRPVGFQGFTEFEKPSVKHKITMNGSFSTENRDLNQQLLQAKSDIHRLKLELQKERNMRDMQICKVCAIKNKSNDSASIGEYINRQITKIKEEYEGDLLFQKLEQEADMLSKLDEKKVSPGGSTNCSTVKSPPQMVNGSMTLSSNTSSNKYCGTLYNIPEEGKELSGKSDQVKLPNLSVFVSATKDLKLNQKDLSDEQDSGIFEGMDKYQLIDLLKTQKSDISNLNSKVDLLEFRLNEFECE